MKFNFFHKDHMTKRIILVLCAVTMMGFALSFFRLIDWGADSFTCMNWAICDLIGMEFGNWQAIMNVLMLVLVLIFGCDNLGLGSLANMFLVGYICDFFSFVWKTLFPAEVFELFAVKAAMLIPALLFFVVGAATYMVVDLGTSPYDALAFIVADRIKGVPFKIVRMAYDFFFMVVGICLGGKLQIVTVLMALSLGPAVGIMSKQVQKMFGLTTKG